MHSSHSQSNLWIRFVILLGVASVVVFAVYYVWMANAGAAQNERRALAEARTLSAEMDASWDYVNSI